MQNNIGRKACLFAGGVGHFGELTSPHLHKRFVSNIPHKDSRCTGKRVIARNSKQQFFLKKRENIRVIGSFGRAVDTDIIIITVRHAEIILRDLQLNLWVTI